MAKKWCYQIFRQVQTYKKYILQKKWAKNLIPALSEVRSNLHPLIWRHHRQLDDRHKYPMNNNKDHLVGQLTTSTPDRPGWKWIKAAKSQHFFTFRFIVMQRVITKLMEIHAGTRSTCAGVINDNLLPQLRADHCHQEVLRQSANLLSGRKYTTHFLPERNRTRCWK